ncbi:MAG: hypothetical protein R2815_00405 [Flavobacteriales bacterium]
MARRLLIVMILVVGVVLGALRDFIFINLNYQLDFLRNHRAVSFAHSAFRKAVEGWDLVGLTALKWMLAAFFIACTALLSVLLARILFGDHRYARPIVLGYLLVAGLAVVLHFLSTPVPAFGGVALKLLHLLQYPVLLFFLWAAATLRQRLA